MKKRPDMQVVGAKIYRLRREKGLCIVDFARELEQPLWLVMLLESAHMPRSKRLIDLLPDSAIETLLREIREVYGVSNRWLTTRYQSPKHPPLPGEEQPLDPLMYLPVTLSSSDFMSLLDHMLALMTPGPNRLTATESMLREITAGLLTLFQLQQALLRQDGCDALAQQEHQHLQLLIQQRLDQLTPGATPDQAA